MGITGGATIRVVGVTFWALGVLFQTGAGIIDIGTDFLRPRWFLD